MALIDRVTDETQRPAASRRASAAPGRTRTAIRGGDVIDWLMFAVLAAGITALVVLVSSFDLPTLTRLIRG